MHIQILKRKKMSRFSKFKKGSILVESEAMKGGKIFFFPFCKVGSAIPTGGEWVHAASEITVNETFGWIP